MNLQYRMNLGITYIKAVIACNVNPQGPLDARADEDRNSSSVYRFTNMLSRFSIFTGWTLLCVCNATNAVTYSSDRILQTFAGSAMDAERAARIVHKSGFDLIDFHSCDDQSNDCALVAVKRNDGEAFVYELSAEPCEELEPSCLSGFKIHNQVGVTKSKPGASRPEASSAKVSGAPGKDGLPADSQDEAQADATNEIIESLGDGKYDNNYDQFWDDLESIQTWNNPSWIEPDPRPPTADKVKVTGSHNSTPATLVSGRYKDTSGDKLCGFWVGRTSTTATININRNWIGNAIADGCDSEVAVFSENGAAQLSKPERNWSSGNNILEFSLSAPIKVPTSVWVIKPKYHFVKEKLNLESEFEIANDILSSSRCGIKLDMVADEDIHDKTSVLVDSDKKLGCASIETVLKPIGFHENRMNVYIVNALISDKRAGVACTAESENVIVLDGGRSDTALIHEFGHWFDLWHTNGKAMSLVNINNVMSSKGLDTMLTAGQCYRANFSKNSYINKRGLRSGKTKKCAHLQDADNNCPGLKNEF